MSMISRRAALSLAASGLIATAAGAAMPRGRRHGAGNVGEESHPRVLATPADRDAVKAKIGSSPWAREAYGLMKKDVDRYTALCATDPAYLTSRLMMNWQTHYTETIVEKDKFVRGEGFAPIPTPRFAGERDWATHYALPATIEEFRPYNDSPDKTGKIWLFNRETNQVEWTVPVPTGQCVETANRRLMDLASQAAFVYWLTGDERYAKVGGDVLWTFLEGFQYVHAPRDLGKHNQIIGSTSFEVIHDAIMPPLGLAYDFLGDYLKRQGRDVAMLEAQLQRMNDRIIEGGSAEGNWNLNECMMFAYPGLALDPDTAFANKRGRQYYIDVLLNARLPAQKGIVHVIKEGYDQKTALWPEAPGYGFGATPQMILFATLVSDDPAGKALLDDPFLTRAILAQLELIHPNGRSIGLGDTTNSTVSAQALELLIASARKRGDQETEARLTTALRREIASGRYDRSKESTLLALTKYVGELKPAAASSAALGRTYFGEPLNVLMQRNEMPDSAYSLVAAMYGTKGGHVHANGLTIELYGAGLILGADPGRGASYWTADHHEYYSQPPAHNTVIVNGISTYAENAKPQHAMTLTDVEPASGADAISSSIGVATAGFRYERPEAEQQRTLAVVRTGPKSGFYFDVFRSRAKAEAGSFHDYIYHNMGQQFSLTGADGKAAALAPSQQLTSANGCAKGYDYFKNERSMVQSGDVNAVFTTSGATPAKQVMGLWMPGQPDRTMFAVDAPFNHAIREGLPREFDALPMPTVVVRQQGDAWSARPFVAVYEPYLASDGPSVRSARAAVVEGDPRGLAACHVEGRDGTALLLQSDDSAIAHKVEGDISFVGAFGTILRDKDRVSEIYLVNGQSLGSPAASVALEAAGNASLSRHGDDNWRITSTVPLTVELTFFPKPGSPASVTGAQRIAVHDAAGKPVIPGNVTVSAAASATGPAESRVVCSLPAGQGYVVTLA